MFRIIRAELKKTFSRPGIFVLTAILIVVLFASAILYKPQARDNYLVSIESKIPSVKNPTVQNLYDYFSSAKDGFDDNTKAGFDKKFTDIQDVVDFYYFHYYKDTEYGSTIDESKYTTQLIVKVSDLVANSEQIKKDFKAYENVVLIPNSSSDSRTTERENLRNSIKSLQSKLVEISKNSSKIIALIEEDVRQELNDDVLVKADNILNNTQSGWVNDVDAYEKIIESKMTEKIDDALSKFIEYKPSQEVLDHCLDYIEGAKEQTAVINDEINTFIDTGSNASSTDKSLRKDFNTLVTRYKLTVKECQNIIDDYIKYDVLKQFAPNDVQKYSAVADVNIYELQERLTKNQFMFENNSVEIDYATPLSITQTSNDTANAFDFAYFALRLCSFIIIIYLVVLSATSIAGEQQAGTFKLLAIRPFSRTKLFIGKMLSTILMGLILLMISSIATFIAGLIKFGTAFSLPVLMVFNASSAFTMSVGLEFLLMIGTMIFELVFFVIIAYAISTIFRSNVGAVAVSIFIYFATLILNTIAPTATFLRFLPFTNINLFKYFGSSFLSTQLTSFLFAVLTPSVILGSNFVFSLLISGIFAVVILVISLVVFNKRDLK